MQRQSRMDIHALLRAPRAPSSSLLTLAVSGGPKRDYEGNAVCDIEQKSIGVESVSFARGTLPTLIVSGRRDVTGPDAINRLKTEWNVSTIVNLMTADEPDRPSAADVTMYGRLGIAYRPLPVVENSLDPLPGAFFDALGKLYIEHYENRRAGAFLVHCLAGCNRSGIAMAALLWMTSPEGTWSSMEMLREWMRTLKKTFINKDAYLTALKTWSGESAGRRFAPATRYREGLAMRTKILDMQSTVYGAVV